MIFNKTNFNIINISPTTNRKQHHFKDTDIVIDNVYDDEYSFKCDTAFGSTVKYINCAQLKKAKLENTFGNLVVYFDTANLYNNTAIALIDNTFGKTTLYIPKEWNVCLDIDDSFGQTNEKGRFDPNSIDTLYIKGDNTFGNLEINYV